MQFSGQQDFKWRKNSAKCKRGNSFSDHYRENGIFGDRGHTQLFKSPSLHTKMPVFWSGKNQIRYSLNSKVFTSSRGVQNVCVCVLPLSWPFFYKAFRNPSVFFLSFLDQVCIFWSADPFFPPCVCLFFLVLPIMAAFSFVFSVSSCLECQDTMNRGEKRDKTGQNQPFDTENELHRWR